MDGCIATWLRLMTRDICMYPLYILRSQISWDIIQAISSYRRPFNKIKKNAKFLIYCREKKIYINTISPSNFSKTVINHKINKKCKICFSEDSSNILHSTNIEILTQEYFLCYQFGYPIIIDEILKKNLQKYLTLHYRDINIKIFFVLSTRVSNNHRRNRRRRIHKNVWPFTIEILT